MADLQALFQVVNELSAEDLKELYRYITETRMEFTNPPIESPQSSERIFDLHPGEFRLGEQ